MAKPGMYIDGLLRHWGDRLFYEPVRARKAPRAVRAAGSGWSGTAQAIRAQIARTVKRTPEVMVKITNRAGSRGGMSGIRAHLEYISRNGEVELEDHNGESLSGRDEVQDLAQAWRFGGRGIPEESERRESFHVMLSMPPGTDRAAVRSAARAFAREEFGERNDYVFAAHNDEAHPHVHLVVLTRGCDGRRLNPRKADLQRWRERFAHELRERGVEANATPRRTRGVTQRYESHARWHMQRRGASLNKQLSAGTNATAAFDAHGQTLAAWRASAEALAGSSDPADRNMAMDIADFVTVMPVVAQARSVSTPGAPRKEAAPPSGRDDGRTAPPAGSTQAKRERDGQGNAER